MLLVQSIAFSPPESVVPGSNHIHTAVEQITGGGGGKPVAVGGIFPVGDDQVNAFQLFQRRQTLSEKLAANAATTSPIQRIFIAVSPFSGGLPDGIAQALDERI